MWRVPSVVTASRCRWDENIIHKNRWEKSVKLQPSVMTFHLFSILCLWAHQWLWNPLSTRCYRMFQGWHLSLQSASRYRDDIQWKWVILPADDHVTFITLKNEILWLLSDELWMIRLKVETWFDFKDEIMISPSDIPHSGVLLRN